MKQLAVNAKAKNRAKKKDKPSMLDNAKDPNFKLEEKVEVKQEPKPVIAPEQEQEQEPVTKPRIGATTPDGKFYL